jgi:hypothetical protein
MSGRWQGEGYVDGFCEAVADHAELRHRDVSVYLQVYPDRANVEHRFVAGAITFLADEDPDYELEIDIPLAYSRLEALPVPAGTSPDEEWDLVVAGAAEIVASYIREALK